MELARPAQRPRVSSGTLPAQSVTRAPNLPTERERAALYHLATLCLFQDRDRRQFCPSGATWGGGITRRQVHHKPFRAWHDLRHTALTHEAAAGNPAVYVQLRAGHSQGSITERYIHAAQVLFPRAAARGEARMFGPDVTAEAPADAEGVETG